MINKFVYLQKKLNKIDMAKLIRANGEIIEIEPTDRNSFTLKEMNEYVGGWIEVIYLASDKVMVLNEEGKLIGLPTNETATDIYGNYDTIVGDVMIIDRNQIK